MTKKKDIKISVITPSFNSGKFIERAIESVLEQDYKRIEHIVIDGGSTDGTLDILKKHKHLKWVSEPDKGQADAMNKGFKKSTGDVIVYLNADDYFFPKAFSAVIEEFKKGEEFVMGNTLVKSARLECEFLNVPRTTLSGMLRLWEPNAFSNNALGYFYTRKVQKACPFNITNNVTMDIEFLFDAVSKFPFVKIEKTLGCFEDGKETTTGKSQARLDFWKPETFPYIEKYVAQLKGEEKAQYLKDRRIGFSLMQAHMNRLNKPSFEAMKGKELPSISVIIPTYNCEKFIGRAIDSVLSQGVKDLEIIVIDDASTDGTADILEKNYGSNATIVVVRNEKNKRQGLSRNVGLDVAKGKYVFFLDSDDWLESGALAHLASVAERYHAEIVACGVNMTSENGKSERYHSFAFASSGGRDALGYLIDFRIGSIIWNKLYLREFIERNDLRFVDSYGKEDVIFTIEAVYRCKNYISINDFYYNYFQRSDSYVNSVPTVAHLTSYVQLYKDMVDLVERIGLAHDEEGDKLCKDLLTAHCSIDIFPRLIKYKATRNQPQWERECWIACRNVLGIKGYALASFMIDAMREKDKPQARTIERQGTSPRLFFKDHLNKMIRGRTRRFLKKVYYALRLNKSIH